MQRRPPVRLDELVGTVGHGLGRRAEHRRRQYPAHWEPEEEEYEGFLAGRRREDDSELLDALDDGKDIIETIQDVVLGNVDVPPARIRSIDLKEAGGPGRTAWRRPGRAAPSSRSRRAWDWQRRSSR